MRRLLLLLLSLLAACTAPTASTEQPTAAPPVPEAPTRASTAAAREPWTTAQLLAPADLASRLSTPANRPAPVVFDLGPAGLIRGAIEIGPAQEEANLQALRAQLAKLPNSTEVVVYCGCCPFENCPNIRPAMRELAARGFTNRRLLNLPENLKVDWIDHGYPMAPKP